ncbi:hypothetical protein OAQ69_02670 [Gammaproteobacteria bacterium]|jgi:hypothetical protein|nr:hypothetical protein [Gammaproteobacteria bacterium]
MKFYIYALSLLFSLNTFAEFDTKCSILITKRLQTSEDAYKDAINKIDQCDKYDILSVTSFLEEPISKIYITDLIQTYCMFDHQIITLLDKNTSNLSCVHRGKSRIERRF